MSVDSHKAVVVGGARVLGGELHRAACEHLRRRGATIAGTDGVSEVHMRAEPDLRVRGAAASATSCRAERGRDGRQRRDSLGRLQGEGDLRRPSAASFMRGQWQEAGERRRGPTRAPMGSRAPWPAMASYARGGSREKLEREAETLQRAVSFG
ncbi:hypothetical protein SETIT_9G274300v2 [Setaria italica]|uniref:Uncharacterized protein n=1 Tax=Setaria italica TaxID=4555 RepID=A0A368SLA7_SETIT|nr:hypothetical protein SETIT_9G274300v2 [Setaria italica]